MFLLIYKYYNRKVKKYEVEKPAFDKKNWQSKQKISENNKSVLLKQNLQKIANPETTECLQYFVLIFLLPENSSFGSLTWDMKDKSF